MNNLGLESVDEGTSAVYVDSCVLIDRKEFEQLLEIKTKAIDKIRQLENPNFPYTDAKDRAAYIRALRWVIGEEKL